MIENIVPTKVCLKCNIPKPLEYFHRWKHSSDGRQTWCKECLKTYGTVQKHRERIREQVRIRRQDPEHKKREAEGTKKRKRQNPERYLWRAAKDRSTKFGIPFDITIDDVIIPEICPILKVPMTPGTRYAPSIDKKVPELGYVKGNIQVISLLANRMKGDATTQELKAFAEYFITLNPEECLEQVRRNR